MAGSSGRIPKAFKAVLLSLSSLALASANLSADEINLGPPLIPSRPGILMAYVKGQRLRVVGYYGDDPIVVDAGGTRTVSPGAPVSLIAGDRYAAGKITFSDARTIAEVTRKMGQVADQGAETRFIANLKSDEDISNTFLVLVAFENLEIVNLVPPTVAILARNIGNLEAGKTRLLDAEMPPLTHDRPFRWGALVFTNGYQVSDEGAYGTQVLSVLFDQVDHVGLKKVIAQRRTGDFPLMVYRHFPVTFGKKMKERHAGQTITVRISVSAEGYAERLDLRDVSDAELAAEIGRVLRLWLFIPKITAGLPQKTFLDLPLKF